MREQGNWTVSLGEWGGVRLRLHALFLLFAAFVVYVAQLRAESQAVSPDRAGWLAAMSVLVLYFSVLLHEAAHWLVARRHDASIDEIVIGPWGGLQNWRLPDDPRRELRVIVAGPLANLLLAWVVCFPLLRMDSPHIDVRTLLDPFAPEGLVTSAAIGRHAIVSIAFWINWVLFLVNMLPAFPFDGGGLVRCLLQMWRTELNREFAILLVARLARWGTFGLLVLAWFARADVSTGPIAPWFAMVAVSGTIYFSSLQQERRALATVEAWGVAEALAGTRRRPPPREQSVPRSSVGELLDTSDGWEDEQQRRHEAQEAEDERRLDEILARLPAVGLSGLSPEERDLLHRVSARYRERNSNRA